MRSDLAKNDLSDLHGTRPITPDSSETPTDSVVSIRAPLSGYLIALFLGTFVSSLTFYLEFDVIGFAIVIFCWIIIPALALGDRVVYNGKRLFRTGSLPRLWAWISGSRRYLKLADIEQVETLATRTLRRGRNISYRYRITFRGKGISISSTSGGEDFRRLVRAILPRLAEHVLDNRSLELRDYLADPKETLTRAEFTRIPSAEVLQESLVRTGWRSKLPDKPIELTEHDADELQSLANELRLSGYLVQAVEAFRRALILRPRDARLIFDFARCLHSLAAVERSDRLERRALAALRLSESRAGSDRDLLVRVGEWYFQIGDWRRAARIFRTVIEDFGENFLALRGLAEIALREGKIAHVIHHFSAATRTAATPGLRRWSSNEAEYFHNLQSDDEYMELEISRVNLLDTVERSRRSALRIAFFAFPLIIVGLIFEDSLVANIGWAISTVALMFWIGLLLSVRMLTRRLPYELVDQDE